MSATIYSGSGKVLLHNAVSLQAEGVNGAVSIKLNEATAQIAAAMFGRIGEQVTDQTVDITTKPFDSWGILPYMFPTYLGVTCGASTGAILIGKRPHDAAVVSTSGASVWTPDGRLYTLVRAAITGHPSLHLGTGKALFGDVKISCFPDPTVSMGTGGYLFASSNPIYESGQTDPAIALALYMSMSDFVREKWTASWGAVTGFTGMEAEDEWTIEPSIAYTDLKVQQRSLAMKLDSVEFMIRVRPYGPTHTQILTQVGSHTHGQVLGSADLVLTSATTGKTITLKNAGVRGAGFEFGGTALGTGEIGFVNEMTFTTGAAQPLLVFSA
jgi:hypothetical protein